MASSAPQKPLRLWPGVVIVILQLISLYAPGYLAPGTMVMALVFLAVFAVYYFTNWKLLSVVWQVG